MKYENKDEKNLIEFAKQAKIKIFLNNYLKEKLNFLEDYAEKTKKILNECILKKGQESLSIFNNYQNDIKNDNNKLLSEFDKINNKHEILLKSFINDIPIGVPILLEEKNNNFCLRFIEIENNSIIQGLNKSIKQSKEHEVSRETIRDSLVDNEKGDKEMEKYITNLQNIMLYELKKYNVFNKKIKKYNLQKKEILNNIQVLNNYISNNKNSNKINTQINEGQKDKKKKGKKIKNIANIIKSCRQPEVKLGLQDNLSDDENKQKKYKGKNKIINSFKNINDLFNTSIHDIELEQEIHDDDGIYENKFENKNQLSTTYIKQIHKFIPKLKFGLIKYNQRNASEIDVYSLQRRKFKHKTLKNQIKEMAKKKESAELRLNNLKKKVEDLEILTNRMKENYKSMKIMVNYNNSISDINPNFILNSLNNGKINNNKNEEENKVESKNKQNNSIEDFLSNVEEIEEEYIDEKSEEKDTKDTKKEDEDEKSNIKSTRKFNKFSIKSTIKAYPNNISLKKTNSK